MIDECVRTTLKNTIMEQRINNIVSDVIKKNLYESEDQNTEMKRNAVIKALKDPKYNHAQLAYSL